MTLAAGSTLGPYRVVSLLGAGGMGEVYRATDTKLGRDVALKVLPVAFAADAQRMARFQREAQVLASLNHTNIATIHGLEESGATRALVMELVEGPTLAERIAQGAVPLDEALPIAKQIAEALEYAHEHGIIHRDLKPANIKLTADGQVKVLDFGLAKALADEASPTDLTNSPTLSVAATKAGLILGTAAYMSPEQARGKSVDRRTDIWAFGVVIYEMLSGRRLYTGETASDILAAVLRSDLDWSALPANTPRSVKNLLQRCLERDAKRRLQSIGEARILLEDVIAGGGKDAPAAPATETTVAGGRGSHAPWMLCAALALIALALGWVVVTGPTASPNSSPVRFSITLPADRRLSTLLEGTNSVVAVSPDGTKLAYVAVGPGGSQLFVRSLDQLEARPLPGTEDAVSPSFSPDGKWLLYVNDSRDRLMKVALDGGSPVEVSRSDYGGAAWSPENTIVFPLNYSAGLQKVSADGGPSQKLTEPDRQRGDLGHFWPQFLPDGNTVLYTAFSTPVSKANLMALSLETGKQTLVLEGATYGRYLPTGHLIFMREEGLMAAPFDLSRLAVRGSPVRVLEDAFLDPQDGYSFLSVSSTGTLVYIPKSSLSVPNEVVWVDRQGKEQPIGLPKNFYENPRLSPDGRRLALATAPLAAQDVWVYDLVRRTMTIIANGPTSEFAPLWTADGKSVFYNLERPQFDIFTRAADGTGKEQVVATNNFDKNPHALSPDGKVLFYTERNPETAADIWTLPLEKGGKPQPYLRSPASEEEPAISPDGRWVAYASNVSGARQVFVQAFPEPGERWQVSNEGGTSPLWSRNGGELFYWSGDKMMAVKVQSRPTFSAGSPQMLFRGDYDGAYPGPNYDVAADGRFLLVKANKEVAPRTIVVVLNWFEELKRLVPIQ